MQTAAPPLSALANDIPRSAIREIFARAASTPGCVRLEVGQPDFRTPDHICEAAARAIAEGWHGYTPMGGLPSLRERLVSKLRRVNGIETTADRIVVGNGGTGVLSAAVTAVCGPGDEVLIPDPHWQGYGGIAAVARAQAVLYPCPAELDYQPDLDRLEALVTPRTRALVINTPHNPTGSLYPAEVLDRLGQLAERHGLWIVSDECYDQIVLDGTEVAPSMLRHADPDRVIAIFTFSKTYAMTGWRVGYGTGPARALKPMATIIDSMSSSINAIGQKAAEAALDGPQDCVGEMVSAYRRRRDLTVDLLREAGLLRSEPSGAFYAMVDITPAGLSSLDFTYKLLDERNVAVSPGSVYGPGGEGAVRVSLASSDQDLREGLGHLCELVRELSARE